jgi:DNA gyrase subunit A
MLALKSGKAIRFEEAKTRPMGRSASGVRGITLANSKDEVIGMVTIENPQEETVLVVSENGYGKRTYIDDPEDGEEVYRITNRGGKGVKTISITEKTGKLVAIKSVTDNDDLMIINKSGIAIRLAVENLRTMGRATQGVKLINLKGNDSIAAVAKVMRDEEDEDSEIVENTNDLQDGTTLDNSTEENKTEN